MTSDVKRSSAPALVVVGSNHEYASVSVRERLAFVGETLTDGLQALHTRVGEGLILSTCNRTEIYVVSEDEDRARDGIFTFLGDYHHVPKHVLERASYVLSGDEAVDHMFRVASGLDSLVLGEPQILSQIRDALDAAREAESVGPMLQRLATDALRVGKRARTETDIARNRVSIAHAAVELAIMELTSLAGKTAMVIGAGNMATLTAKLLRARGADRILIVNRSLGRAAELAEAVSGEVYPLTGMAQALAEADVVFAAASADGFLVRPEMVAERATPLLAIDLSVPRIIDQGCGINPVVDVRDVDALEPAVEETRRQYAAEVNKVETIVSSAVGEFAEWTRTRWKVEALADLQAHTAAIRDGEIEKALRKLHHLNERDRNIVRALGFGITNKMLHQPIQRIKHAASQDEVQLSLALFGVDPDISA